MFLLSVVTKSVVLVATHKKLVDRVFKEHVDLVPLERILTVTIGMMPVHVVRMEPPPRGRKPTPNPVVTAFVQKVKIVL